MVQRILQSSFLRKADLEITRWGEEDRRKIEARRSLDWTVVQSDDGIWKAAINSPLR